MKGKPTKVNSIDRIVDANLDISEFDHRPSKVRQWFTNNIIRPMFSYLVGWTGSKAVMLKASAQGILKTAVVGGGLEYLETSTGLALAVESGAVALVNVGSRIRVIANTHDMYLRFTRDGVNWEDQIHIKADVEQVFDIACHSFTVQRYGVNDVDYELEAYR